MILVTGATGFLGSELCKQLIANGAKVRALKRNSSKIPSILTALPIEWVVGDLEEKDSIKQLFQDITCVYHCAALVSFDSLQTDSLFKINAMGTQHIVDACIKHACRLVYVSSVATLGDSKPGDLIDENVYPLENHQTHSYGMSKIKGEKIVWEGFARGLNGVIVNPSVIIGKNAGFEGSGALFKLVKEGMKFYTDGVSGFVDVEDVAYAMIALMHSDAAGERYILSSENYSYKKLFSEIARGFNKKPPTIEATPWMLGIAWRAATIGAWITKKPASLTRDAAKSSFNKSYYANRKIAEKIAIKFKPIHIAIQEITAAL